MTGIELATHELSSRPVWLVVSLCLKLNEGQLIGISVVVTVDMVTVSAIFFVMARGFGRICFWGGVEGRVVCSWHVI